VESRERTGRTKRLIFSFSTPRSCERAAAKLLLTASVNDSMVDATVISKRTVGRYWAPGGSGGGEGGGGEGGGGGAGALRRVWEGVKTKIGVIQRGETTP
jgi:hypothetical protein